MRADNTDHHPKHLSLFKIEGRAETPIKDAIKLSLISLAVSFLMILSLFAFAEVWRWAEYLAAKYR